MAGFYDLCRSEGRASDGARADMHLVHSALAGFAAGSFTGAQVKATINAVLAGRGFAVLTTEEETDIDSIGAEINAFNSSQLDQRNQYVNQVWAACYAAEIDESSGMTDTAWRSILGIS